MNAERRKRVAALQEHIGDLRQEAEEIRDAEQDAFDSMPESLQETTNGQASQQAIDALESVIDDLDNAFAGLRDT